MVASYAECTIYWIVQGSMQYDAVKLGRLDQFGEFHICQTITTTM